MEEIDWIYPSCSNFSGKKLKSIWNKQLIILKILSLFLTCCFVSTLPPLLVLPLPIFISFRVLWACLCMIVSAFFATKIFTTKFVQGMQFQFWIIISKGELIFCIGKFEKQVIIQLTIMPTSMHYIMIPNENMPTRNLHFTFFTIFIFYKDVCSWIE